ncbi:D-isomer specific 2-hydroxyacid dehydrogenase family protein [Clostridium amazonitimonense]|uniref:D-isomer specific 2-hydroxyacid dehydrogenase family protein n=1 Tax=Clostridium amazonitimonense TaxID=1499689 RepID=UPI0005098CA9|nr:D-isomer specific 2-hydroxyacid dehydrogenase family protein [Clostridium amazonitimonense]
MKILAYCVRPDELSSFEKYSKQIGHEVTVLKESFGPQNAHLAEGYDAVSILGNCNANKEAIEKISKLGVKYLATRSAGINNIDMEAAKKFDVRACNVPAYSPNAVAEFAVASTLCVARNLQQAIRRVDVQNFGLAGLIGFELRNKTIGFIGTGRIGLTTIKAFSGFGAKMIGYDLYQNEEAKKYIEYRTLDELFKEADIISLHCPLTDDNYHIINRENIAKMRDGVVIVNTARGALMDAEAVIEGLKSGKIAGLATDVYENEVGIFHNDHTNSLIKDDNLARLMQFPNVLVTPHFGFYTDEAVANMVEYSLQNLKHFEISGQCKNEIK